MKTHITLLFILLSAGTLLGQAKPAVPAAPSTATSVDVPLPLPLAERDKFRDLQHEDDSIEIENQKMLVKIEQNKAHQADLRARERLIGWDFAQEKHIDIDLWELDPAQIQFVKKKAK